MKWLIDKCRQLDIFQPPLEHSAYVVRHW